jgi:diamine N-acetyltransferase
VSQVSLREVTAETVRAVCALEVAPGQRAFVAPNAVSIAEAHFAPDAWFRAIHAGEDLVGCLMLSAPPNARVVWLWRFMIAAPFQGKGYGSAALALVLEHARRLPGAELLKLCYVPEPAGPAPFYRRLGFAETGEMEEHEVVMQLAL